jgi:hypothetical protein
VARQRQAERRRDAVLLEQGAALVELQVRGLRAVRLTQVRTLVLRARQQVRELRVLQQVREVQVRQPAHVGRAVQAARARVQVVVRCVRGCLRG